MLQKVIDYATQLSEVKRIDRIHSAWVRIQYRKGYVLSLMLIRSGDNPVTKHFEGMIFRDGWVAYELHTEAGLVLHTVEDVIEWLDRLAKLS